MAPVGWPGGLTASCLAVALVAWWRWRPSSRSAWSPRPPVRRRRPARAGGRHRRGPAGRPRAGRQPRPGAAGRGVAQARRRPCRRRSSTSCCAPGRGPGRARSRPRSPEADADRAAGRRSPVSASAAVDGRTYARRGAPGRGAAAFALVQPAARGRARAAALIRRNLALRAARRARASPPSSGCVVGTLLARPLRRAAAAAHLLRSGRRDVRVPVEGPAEVAEVAGAVNDLADALARSEARQREFLLSVSHELRTPLTAITRVRRVAGRRRRRPGRTRARPARSSLAEAHAARPAGRRPAGPGPAGAPTTSASTSRRSISAALVREAGHGLATPAARAEGVPFGLDAADRAGVRSPPTPGGCGRSSTASPRTPCASPRRARRWPSPVFDRAARAPGA